MTPAGHQDRAETLAGLAAEMLTGLRVAADKPVPPRWMIGVQYAQALTALAAVHAQLAAIRPA